MDARRGRSRLENLTWRALLLVCLWLPVTVFALTPVDVLSLPPQQNLSRFTEHLEDPERTLTLADVRESHAQRFIPGSDTTLNKGYTDSAYWLHLQLMNSAKSLMTPQRVILQLDYPMLDDIEFYVVHHDIAAVYWHTGDLFPATSRPIDHGTFVFPLTIDPGTVNDVYLRVKGSSSMRLPVILWDELEFHKAQRTSALLHGLFYGILLLMAFYNLCLFISVRNINYLVYVGYTLSVTLFQSIMIGDAPVYLWGNYPSINEHVLPAAVALTAGFLIYFSHRVLDFNTFSPGISRLMKILGVLQVAMFFFSIIFPYGTMIRLASIDALIVCTGIIIVVIVAATRKDRSALYFLLAWLMLLMGAIILALVSLGVLPANAFTTNAFYFGNTIEVTLLSLSLAERMRYTLQAKVQAEQRANEALVGANTTLQENNNLKDEFLATISHELRTPMNGVIGSIEQLKQPADPETQHRLIGCADRSAHHLMGLLDSVLTYTELASGKLIIEKQPFMLCTLVKEITDAFSPVCQQKGLTFSIECMEGSRSLSGDARRIQQILHILLDNAVKFTARGSVELLVRRTYDKVPDAESLLFSVIDTGIGIADDAKGLIFEKFRQADGAFNRGHGGLGIGLAIGNELANAMQGHIEFESVENEGSVFNFHLCLPYATKTTAPVPAVPVADTHSAPIVMVVEDNPTNQLVLKGMLKKFGVEVLTANNGQEALDILSEQLVDAILMDCQMPVMDGFGATQAVRLSPPPQCEIPIIAVTANAMAQDKARCLEVGMNDYISKPVNTALLKEKLIYWLARSPQPKRLAT